MIRNVIKRTVPLLLALLVLLVSLPLSLTAQAIDLTQTGTVKIQLRDVYYPDTAIGGTLVLHKVASVQMVNYNLSYTLTGDFTGSGVSLTDLSASGLAKQLGDYAAAQSIAGTTVEADESGYVTFSGLSAGLYLVTQTEAVDGYLPLAPFLVSLPMYDAQSGNYTYTVNAAPKVQRPPKDDITINVVKKWLDNNKDRPESLTIRLLKDGAIVETVEITAQDDWKYTWTGLNAYYTWTVEEVIPEGYSVSYSTRNGTTTITNQASWYKPPKDDLIQTGQLNWPVPILVCTGLFLILTGTVLVKRGKRA